MGATINGRLYGLMPVRAKVIEDPNRAAEAPRYGPKTIPNTDAISAAKEISIVPTVVGILTGAIRDKT